VGGSCPPQVLWWRRPCRVPIITAGFAPVRERERMLLADLQGRVTWRPTTENHDGDAASSRHADDVDRINQQLLRRRSMPPLQLRRPDICPPRNHQWPQGYMYVPKPNLTPNTGPNRHLFMFYVGLLIVRLRFMSDIVLFID